MRLFKLLSFVFLYIAPLTIAFIYLYQKQEAEVSFGFSAIILLVVVWVKLYGAFKKWLALKEQAHEVARNLGQESKTTNFYVIEFANFMFLAFPFVILIWLDYVLKNYNGNAGLVMSFILVSFLASGVFKVLYNLREQIDIRQGVLDREEQAQQRLIERLRGQ